MESQADQGREKRNVHRSPSYPVFDLAEAIEKTKLVYDNDKRASTSVDVIASHLGYSAAKGPGGRAVSALKQYGLIEENAGKFRISNLGYTLSQYDRDSAEWRAAVVEAARNPVLFRELMDENPGGLPSDAALRSELLKRDFNPAAIPEVVKILRNTITLAQEGSSVYNENTEDSLPEAQIRPESAKLPPLQASPSRGRDTLPLLSQALVVSIPRNFRVDISVRGDELRREDLAKIKNQFNRWIEGLEEAFEE